MPVGPARAALSWVSWIDFRCRRANRMMSGTGLAKVDGKAIMAGLSDETKRLLQLTRTATLTTQRGIGGQCQWAASQFAPQPTSTTSGTSRWAARPMVLRIRSAVASTSSSGTSNTSSSCT